MSEYSLYYQCCSRYSSKTLGSQLSCTLKDSNVAYMSSFLLSKLPRDVAYTHTIHRQRHHRSGVRYCAWSLIETMLAVQSGKMGQCKDGQTGCWLRKGSAQEIVKNSHSKRFQYSIVYIYKLKHKKYYIYNRGKH